MGTKDLLAGVEPALRSDGPVGTMSNSELGTRLDGLFRLKSAVDGQILEVLGEVERREAYREEGATSSGA